MPRPTRLITFLQTFFRRYTPVVTPPPAGKLSCPQDRTDGNLGSVCFSFSALLWISFGRSKWSRKREAEKLMERCFQLLAFGTIQFLISRKLMKKIRKNCKQTPLSDQDIPILPGSGPPWLEKSS
jgi:hypothetical protein